MNNFVDRMLDRPAHHRQFFTMVAAFGITALVGLVWVTTLVTGGTFAVSGKPQNQAAAVSGVTAGTPSSPESLEGMLNAQAAQGNNAVGPAVPYVETTQVESNSAPYAIPDSWRPQGIYDPSTETMTYTVPEAPAASPDGL